MVVRFPGSEKNKGQRTQHLSRKHLCLRGGQRKRVLTKKTEKKWERIPMMSYPTGRSRRLKFKMKVEVQNEFF